MSILAYLIITLAIFASGAAGGIKWEIGVIARRDLAIQQKGAEELRRQEHREDVAATGQETDKKVIRAKFIPINQEVNRVTQTDFYRADQPACFDDDGLRQLRAAIATPAPAASQPTGAVPRPGRAHWWESAGDSPLVR